MKKLIISLLVIASLVFPVFSVRAQADEGNGVNIVITPSNQGVNVEAANNPGKVLSNIISIIFALAALMVLFMLILGAFNWITSGGEKEAVGKARNRITHALIGLLVLALAFFIVKIVGGLVHVDIMNLHLPSIDQGAEVNPPASPTS